MTDDFDPNDSAPLPGLMVKSVTLTGGGPGTPSKLEVEIAPLQNALPEDSVSTTSAAGLDPQRWADPMVQAERDRLIKTELGYRNFPTNPMNAARAGWYAGIRHANKTRLRLLTKGQANALALVLQDKGKALGTDMSLNRAHKLLEAVLLSLDVLEYPDE